MSREDRFLTSRRARPRTRAKLASLSIIIADNDYRKGQRPPQFLIIDWTTVKSSFCGADPRANRRACARHASRKRRREKHAKHDGVASFFAISIYSDYSGARSSADRDGNKFDKSIRSATTTRSSLSTRIFATRTRARARAAKRRRIPQDDLTQPEINYFVASN